MIINNWKEIIIINADDFGYNGSMDRGMMELIRKQHVKSLSVMVNGENISEAVEMVEQFKKEEFEKYC
jgi:predicted glycoside hydrolase/deacetylase ChbG (UPF0249 family)